MYKVLKPIITSLGQPNIKIGEALNEDAPILEGNLDRFIKSGTIVALEPKVAPEEVVPAATSAKTGGDFAVTPGRSPWDENPEELQKLTFADLKLKVLEKSDGDKEMVTRLKTKSDAISLLSRDYKG